jgi:hypothetical protein
VKRSSDFRTLRCRDPDSERSVNDWSNHVLRYRNGTHLRISLLLARAIAVRILSNARLARYVTAALAFLASVSVSQSASAASWSTYYPNSMFMQVYTNWGQSSYANISGIGMGSCTSGWTFGMLIINSGGHEDHRIDASSSVCSGTYDVAFGHTDNSYKAMCTNWDGGNESANCRRRV